ncbi:DUF7002 family protein [Pseudonocardia petroleophila]
MLRRAPQVFHTAPAQAWPGIRRRGLLPVAALTAHLDADERERLLTRRRPTDVRFVDPEHGAVWLRDQRPMNETHLARMLDDMTVAGYLARINAMVFLWADRDRLDRLRRLPRYAASAHVVLTLDTASLVAAHRDRIALTRINSGAALFPSGRRGTATFRGIDGFPARDRPVELAVTGGIPDLGRHLVRVQEWAGDEVRDVPLP